VSCEPLLLKRGRTGFLPVKTDRDLTLTDVIWKVQDASGKVLHDHSCYQSNCKVDEMFRVKLEIPGLHRYSVEIKIGGASLKCDSALLIYGLLTTKLSSF
jgi:hypothetical protein